MSNNKNFYIITIIILIKKKNIFYEITQCLEHQIVLAKWMMPKCSILLGITFKEKLLNLFWIKYFF